MATTAPATKKSNKGRKSAAIALAIVGVAGLSLASAAQLTVTSGSLGAGTQIVASCDSAITVGFGNTYNASGYQVTSVVISNVDVTPCQGLNYKIQLKGASGALGSEIAGVLLLTGTGALGTQTFTFSGIDAASVTGVSVVIYS
jgi:hypothetical protein